MLRRAGPSAAFIARRGGKVKSVLFRPRRFRARIELHRRVQRFRKRRGGPIPAAVDVVSLPGTAGAEWRASRQRRHPRPHVAAGRGAGAETQTAAPWSATPEFAGRQRAPRDEAGWPPRDGRASRPLPETRARTRLPCGAGRLREAARDARRRRARPPCATRFRRSPAFRTGYPARPLRRLRRANGSRSPSGGNRFGTRPSGRRTPVPGARRSGAARRAGSKPLPTPIHRGVHGAGAPWGARSSRTGSATGPMPVALPAGNPPAGAWPRRGSGIRRERRRGDACPAQSLTVTAPNGRLRWRASAAFRQSQAKRAAARARNHRSTRASAGKSGMDDPCLPGNAGHGANVRVRTPPLPGSSRLRRGCRLYRSGNSRKCGAPVAPNRARAAAPGAQWAELRSARCRPGRARREPGEVDSRTYVGVDNCVPPRYPVFRFERPDASMLPIHMFAIPLADYPVVDRNLRTPGYLRFIVRYFARDCADRTKVLQNRSRSQQLVFGPVIVALRFLQFDEYGMGSSANIGNQQIVAYPHP